MSRAVIFVTLMIGGATATVYVLAKHVFPEWVGLQERRAEREAELEKARYERDEALVEEAEREVEERRR